MYIGVLLELVWFHRRTWHLPARNGWHGAGRLLLRIVEYSRTRPMGAMEAGARDAVPRWRFGPGSRWHTVGLLRWPARP